MEDQSCMQQFGASFFGGEASSCTPPPITFCIPEWSRTHMPTQSTCLPSSVITKSSNVMWGEVWVGSSQIQRKWVDSTPYSSKRCWYDHDLISPNIETRREGWRERDLAKEV